MGVGDALLITDYTGLTVQDVDDVKEVARTLRSNRSEI
jgi:hypothetical protein